MYNPQELKEWLGVRQLNLGNVLNIMRKQLDEDERIDVTVFNDIFIATLVWMHHDGDIPLDEATSKSHPSKAVFELCHQILKQKRKFDEGGLANTAGIVNVLNFPPIAASSYPCPGHNNCTAAIIDFNNGWGDSEQPW